MTNFYDSFTCQISLNLYFKNPSINKWFNVKTQVVIPVILRVVLFLRYPLCFLYSMSWTKVPSIWDCVCYILICLSYMFICFICLYYCRYQIKRGWLTVGVYVYMVYHFNDIIGNKEPTSLTPIFCNLWTDSNMIVLFFVSMVNHFELNTGQYTG